MGTAAGDCAGSSAGSAGAAGVLVTVSDGCSTCGAEDCSAGSSPESAAGSDVDASTSDSVGGAAGVAGAGVAGGGGAGDAGAGAGDAGASDADAGGADASVGDDSTAGAGDAGAGDAGAGGADASVGDDSTAGAGDAGAGAGGDATGAGGDSIDAGCPAGCSTIGAVVPRGERLARDGEGLVEVVSIDFFLSFPFGVCAVEAYWGVLGPSSARERGEGGIGEGGFVAGLAPQTELSVSPIFGVPFGVDFGVFSLPFPFTLFSGSIPRLRDRSWAVSAVNGEVEEALDAGGVGSGVGWRATSGTPVYGGSTIDDRWLRSPVPDGR